MTRLRAGSAAAESRETFEDLDDPTRESILDATIELLTEDGYANVTTDAIAARARVSKATIYRLWRTKQEVVVEAAQRRFQRLEVPDLGDFEDEIRYVLATRLSDYRQPGLPRLIAGLVGAAASDDALRELLDKWLEELSVTVRKIIQRGIARGDVRLDVDIYAFETLIGGPIARSVIARQGVSEQSVDQLASLLAAAVAPL